MNITGMKGFGGHFVRAFCGDPDAPALLTMTRICVVLAFAIILLAVLLGIALQS